MDGLGMIGAAAFLATLALGSLLLKSFFFKLVGAEDRHRAMIRGLARARRAASLHLRSQIRRSLCCIKERKNAEIEIGELRDKLVRLNASIEQAENDRRSIYYLLDSSASSPRTFAFQVTHPDVATAYGRLGVSSALVDIWRRGRRFLVAGADRTEAMERLRKRLPDDPGFQVAPLELR